MYSSRLFACLLQLTSAICLHHAVRDDLNQSDPAASDPETAPKSIKPLWRPEGQNPFKGNIKSVPKSCTDMREPSQQCIKDLQSDVSTFNNGGFRFEDNSCTQQRTDRLETAAWDAATLAASMHLGNDDPHLTATWRAYIGPDFSDYQDRMMKNFDRAADYKHKKSFEIIISCKDPDGICNKQLESGKSVGGYAWTQKGWFGYRYQHVTLCDIFFGLGDLESVHEMILDGLNSGDEKYARDANWQKNTGQFFLHEMMHLDAVGDPHSFVADAKARHIIVRDESVNEHGGPPKAYGPRMVYKLAQLPLSQGGGAKRASTNADSHVWLANSLYFYYLTEYFPQPPGYGRKVTLDSLNTPDEMTPGETEPPVSVYLGEIDQTTSDVNYTAMVDKAFGSSPPAPSPPTKDKNDCHGVGGDYWVMSRDVAVDNAKTFCGQEGKVVKYNINSVNELELSGSKAGDDAIGPKDDPNCLGRLQNAVIDGCDGNDSKQNPHNYKFGSKFTSSDGWVYEMKPLSKQVNQVSCDVSYKFFFDFFEIRGENLPDAKLGANGEGLKKEIEGCGKLTQWNFEQTPQDVKFQWYAKGHLPIGTKSCIGSALVSAGGADKGSCHGPGRRSTFIGRRRAAAGTMVTRDSIDEWPGYGEVSAHIFGSLEQAR